MSTAAHIYSGNEPPGLPLNNTLWYDDVSGELFIYNTEVEGWLQLTGGTISLPDKSVTIEKLSDDIVDGEGGLQKGSSGLKIAKESAQQIILRISNVQGIDYVKDSTHETKISYPNLYGSYEISDRFLTLVDVYKWVNDNANSPRSEIHIIIESPISDVYELYYIKTGLSTFGYSKNSSMVPNNALGNIHHWSLGYWNYLTGQADHIEDLTLVTLTPDSVNRLSRIPFAFEDNCSFHGIHFLFDLKSSGIEHQTLFLANGCSMKFSYCKISIIADEVSYDSSKLDSVFQVTNGGLIKVTSDIYGQPMVGTEVSTTTLGVVTTETVYCDGKIWDGGCDGGRQTFLLTRELLDPFRKGMPSHAIELNCRQIYINNIFHAKNKSVIEIKEYRNNITSSLGTECSAFHMSNDSTGSIGKVRFSHFVKLDDFSKFDTNTKFSVNNLLTTNALSSFNCNSYNSINVGNILTTINSWTVDEEGNAIFPEFSQGVKVPKLYSEDIFTTLNKAPFFTGSFPIEADYRGTTITLDSTLTTVSNLIGDGVSTIDELIAVTDLTLTSGDGAQIPVDGETISTSGGSGATPSSFNGTFLHLSNNPSQFTGEVLIASGASPIFSGTFNKSTGYTPKFIGHYAVTHSDIPTTFNGVFILEGGNVSEAVEIILVEGIENINNLDSGAASISNEAGANLDTDLIIMGDGTSTIQQLIDSPETNVSYAATIDSNLQSEISTVNTSAEVIFTDYSQPEYAEYFTARNSELQQDFTDSSLKLYIKSGDANQIPESGQAIRLGGQTVRSSASVYIVAQQPYSGDLHLDFSLQHGSEGINTLSTIELSNYEDGSEEYAEIIQTLTGISPVNQEMKFQVTFDSSEKVTGQKLVLSGGFEQGTSVDIQASEPHDQDIDVSGDGIKTLNELVTEAVFCASYNGAQIEGNCERFGTLSILSGDGTQIPREGEIITLTGGNVNSTTLEISSTLPIMQASQISGDGIKTIAELIVDYNAVESQKEADSIDPTTGLATYTANEITVNSGDDTQTPILGSNINLPDAVQESTEVTIFADSPGIYINLIDGDGVTSLTDLLSGTGASLTSGDGTQIPVLGQSIEISGGEEEVLSTFTGDFLAVEPEGNLTYQYGSDVSITSNIVGNHTITLTGNGTDPLSTLCAENLCTLISGDDAQILKSGQSITLSGGSNADSEYSYSGPALTSSNENTQTTDSDYF